MQAETAPQQNLTDTHYKVLNHLISGVSISEAARLAGVHRNTVTNWRRQIPAFAQLLNEALQERSLLFREEVESLAFKALGALRDILENEDASPSVRLRAALAVLNLSARPEPKPQTETKRPLPSELCNEPEKTHKAAQSPVEIDSRKPCPCGSQVRYGLCCSPDSPVHPSRALLQTDRTAAQPVQAVNKAVNEICGVEK